MPGHDDLKNFAEDPRVLTQAASAALAFSAIAWNAAGSWMARSDSTLRSTVIPDFERPLINTLYVMPNGRTAALSRWIHSARKVRFLRLRSRKAYWPAFSTAALAARIGGFLWGGRKKHTAALFVFFFFVGVG